MKKIELTHPRVFNDPTWANGYFKRNRNNIVRVGKRLASLLKKSGFTTGKILDVGCGFAAVPIEIAKTFPDVQITGIDLAEPLLDIGKILVDKAGFENRILLQNGDAQNLQFEKNSFDVVINSFLLHIVDDPVKMLNEMERVASPEAKILITDLRRGFLANFIKKFKMSLTLDEATAIIKNSALREGTPSTGPFWWDYTIGLY